MSHIKYQFIGNDKNIKIKVDLDEAELNKNYQKNKKLQLMIFKKDK